MTTASASCFGIETVHLTRRAVSLVAELNRNLDKVDSELSDRRRVNEEVKRRERA